MQKLNDPRLKPEAHAIAAVKTAGWEALVALAIDETILALKTVRSSTLFTEGTAFALGAECLVA
jgi:hypothetical protein